MSKENPSVVIIDYGMGNLFSVLQACAHAGVQAVITQQKEKILKADGVILPGVGASLMRCRISAS